METSQNRIVIAAIDDMFFAAKVKAAAARANITVAFIKNAEGARDAARSAAITLFIADLQSSAIDVYSMAEELKTFAEFEGTRFIGFYSHVNSEIRARALASGFDKAIPRSVFSRDLDGILSGTS